MFIEELLKATKTIAETLAEPLQYPLYKHFYVRENKIWSLVLVYNTEETIWVYEKISKLVQKQMFIIRKGNQQKLIFKNIPKTRLTFRQRL